MTSSEAPLDDDNLLAHEFIRRFGRRPSPRELAKYRDARARIGYRMRSRAQRRFARLITRV